MQQQARFITVEGIDGAGKSTQLTFIASWLKEQGINAVFTREPGGTPLGETLRHLLLDKATELSLDTETLLMFASRQQLVTDVIRPALDAGCWVVSDRFTDATYAYQGGGRGMPCARIRPLEQWVQQELQPDLTLLFDIPFEFAMQRRIRSRGLKQDDLDRFEQEDAAFHHRVRQAYLQRAREHPRFCIIDANRDPKTVAQDVSAVLHRLWEMS